MGQRGAGDRQSGVGWQLLVSCDGHAQAEASAEVSSMAVAVCVLGDMAANAPDAQR